MFSSVDPRAHMVLSRTSLQLSTCRSRDDDSPPSDPLRTLTYGYDSHLDPDNGCSRLWLAAHESDWELVHTLIEHKAVYQDYHRLLACAAVHVSHQYI
jgi:hypothetical protein